VVTDQPLNNSTSFYLSTPISTIGVNNNYSSYQQIFSLAVSSFRGSKLLRSLKVINNTNQSVDIQIRNQIGGVVGANNDIKTVASGGTYEFTPHEISFLIADGSSMPNTSIVARFRTASASYTGTVDFTYGGNNI
jgi:ribosomal protein S9